jgi:hypothetical protein
MTGAKFDYGETRSTCQRYHTSPSYINRLIATVSARRPPNRYGFRSAFHQGSLIGRPDIGNVLGIVRLDSPAADVGVRVAFLPKFKNFCAPMRDCREFWGVCVNGVFPRPFFDQEWARGLGFEVGENRR